MNDATPSRVSAVIVLALTLSLVPVASAQTGPDCRPSAHGADDADGADVIGALDGFFRLLIFEHSIRVAFQEKTRRELGGLFWRDYQRSVRWPRQWGDTDAWYVNYLGHPIHGAAAGYIWLDNDGGRRDEYGFTKSYWTSRARATAFAAAYSLQFEVGPISEAAIGKVGMLPKTAGWVDHLITPVGALGIMVAEDAIDRYLVTWAERRIRNRVARASLRFVLTPGRTMSNTVVGRSPWSRDRRPLDAP